MVATKQQLNGKVAKKTRKKTTRKKTVPGSRQAVLESVEIIKKYNLDFSYLKQ